MNRLWEEPLYRPIEHLPVRDAEPYPLVDWWVMSSTVGETMPVGGSDDVRPDVRTSWRERTPNAGVFRAPSDGGDVERGDIATAYQHREPADG